MQYKTELWMRLCEMAAKEQDPQELMRLVALINRLLERKEIRHKKPMTTELPRKSQAA
jgi:hypothetical protein